MHHASSALVAAAPSLVQEAAVEHVRKVACLGLEQRQAAQLVVAACKHARQRTGRHQCVTRAAHTHAPALCCCAARTDEVEHHVIRLRRRLFKPASASNTESSLLLQRALSRRLMQPVSMLSAAATDNARSKCMHSAALSATQHMHCWRPSLTCPWCNRSPGRRPASQSQRRRCGRCTWWPQTRPAPWQSEGGGGTGRRVVSVNVAPSANTAAAAAVAAATARSTPAPPGWQSCQRRRHRRAPARACPPAASSSPAPAQGQTNSSMQLVPPLLLLLALFNSSAADSAPSVLLAAPRSKDTPATPSWPPAALLRPLQTKSPRGLAAASTRAHTHTRHTCLRQQQQQQRQDALGRAMRCCRCRRCRKRACKRGAEPCAAAAAVPLPLKTAHHTCSRRSAGRCNQRPCRPA